MRALPATTSLIAVMILATVAEAQRPGLPGLLTFPPERSPSRKEISPGNAPELSVVEDVDIPDLAVPELLSTLEQPAAVSEVAAARTLPPATAQQSQPNADRGSVDTVSFEVPVEQPVFQDTFVSDPGAILDAGQPYDIPVSDVIVEEGAAETYSTNNWFRGGRWYSQQDFVLLLRADLPTVHLAVERDGLDAAQGRASPSATNSMSSRAADFTYEAGVRITIGKILGRDVANRDHSLDVRYFGLFDYTGAAAIAEVNPADDLAPNDPNGITVSGIDTLLGTVEANSTLGGTSTLGFARFNPVDGFDLSTTQQIRYEANLNSVEMNYMIGARPARDRLVMQPDGRWVRHATPSKVRGMFAGLRYIRQHESFNYTADGRANLAPIVQGAAVVNGATGVVQRRGDYRVDTENDLFGIQLGGEWLQKRTDWVFGAEGRVGGFLNFANRDSRLIQVVDQDLGNAVDLLTTTRTQGLDDETLTFLSEVHVYLAYYLRPNTSVRVGYNFLYLNGMATATNNLGLQGEFPKFELTGDSLYHGMTLGFNMTW